MAKGQNIQARAAYKAGLVEALACIRATAGCGDTGLAFWADELQRVIERQLAHKTLSQAPIAEVRTATKAEDRTDPAYRALAALTAERDAAVARAEAVGARFRAGRKEDGEGWERAEALTREINGWKGLLAQANTRATRAELELARLREGADLAAPDPDDSEFWAGRAEAAVASLDGTELDVPMWADVA